MRSPKSLFAGRRLVIATQHKKEQVLAPLLEAALGVKCLVPPHFDTDALGSFCGTISRKADPVSTARYKCEQALDLTGCDLGIASEGSFGPHPSLWFVPADEEILVLIDRHHHLEIVVRELSIDTNFDAETLTTEEQLIQFADRAGFPSHALMLRPAKGVHTGLVKGIQDFETLRQSYRRLQEEHGSVYAETDMRALYNPTRMQVIGKAAENLVEKVKSCCPQCHTPGFGVTAVKSGLPCGQCQFPTQSTRSLVYTCAHCAHETEHHYPNTKETEDPLYCPLCNP